MSISAAAPIWPSSVAGAQVKSQGGTGKECIICVSYDEGYKWVILLKETPPISFIVFGLTPSTNLFDIKPFQPNQFYRFQILYHTVVYHSLSHSSLSWHLSIFIPNHTLINSFYYQQIFYQNIKLNNYYSKSSPSAAALIHPFRHPSFLLLSFSIAAHERKSLLYFK